MSSSRSRPNNTIEHASARTLRVGFTFFTITCLVATVGYVAAGWGWVDALYMVTITIFGVGYGEVRPMDEPWLKFFTMGVIFAGCSSLIYVIGGVIQMLAEGEIEQMLGLRNRSREIDQLSDHTIICGYGRVGQMLAVELANHDESLVIVDRDPELVDKAISDGFLSRQGDAVDEDVLCQLGLLRAKTLAAVLPDDATNVFVTLTARDLNASIRIVARAECPSTERKLMRGGATSVVIPSAIGAIRIAQLATCPIAESPQLPEDRFRLLAQTARKESVSEAAAEIEQAVQADVEELAHLAEDLTRSLVERHDQEISENA